VLAAVPAFATAPALIIVGVLMAGNVAYCAGMTQLKRFLVLTIIMMPLTYSIARRSAMGFITYPLIKAFQGKAHEISLAVWITAAIFVVRFIMLALKLASNIMCSRTPFTSNRYPVSDRQLVKSRHGT
jgi:AGZA family xanthine/uracil permease-like MFS transporter